MDNTFDEASDAAQLRRAGSRSRADSTRRSARDRTRQRAQNGAAPRDNDKGRIGAAAAHESDKGASAKAGVVAHMGAVATKSADFMGAVATKGVDFMKRAALAGGCAFGLVLLLQNQEPARKAVEALFELAPHIKQLTVAGFDVIFDEPTVGSALKVVLDPDSDQAKDPTYIGKITEIIQSLKPDHYRRLMYVDQLHDLCKYEHQPIKGDFDFSLDQDLAEKGLVKLEASPELLKEILGTDLGGIIDPKLGFPQFCYKMTLTAKGYDVKSAFVGTMIKYAKTASR